MKFHCWMVSLIRLLFQMRLQKLKNLTSLPIGLFLLLEFWQQW